MEAPCPEEYNQKQDIIHYVECQKKYGDNPCPKMKLCEIYYEEKLADIMAEKNAINKKATQKV